jgi:hypothetical protein
MRIIAALIIGLALGITIGVTGDVLATPPPDQNSTEGRLQALEYLLWTEDHAINAVSQRLWERYSSCNLGAYTCYNNDLVLMPFTTLKTQNGYLRTAEINYLLQHANTHGAWYAQDNGDGDSWNVWVIITVKDQQGYDVEFGPFTWTVWQSNGFIRGVY